MLQRIQTIYFIIAMLLFGSLFGGLNFLNSKVRTAKLAPLTSSEGLLITLRNMAKNMFRVR